MVKSKKKEENKIHKELAGSGYRLKHGYTLVKCKRAKCGYKLVKPKE